METQKLYGEGYDEPIFELVVSDDIHFALQPREVVILVMALKIAIKKADMYKGEMKYIHDYIIKNALEQQKEMNY